MNEWVANSPNYAFLAADPAIVSQTSVCLRLVDDWYTGLAADQQKAVVKDVEALLAAEDVAIDISAYRDAPTGLRIWCGPTVDPDDIAALLPWLDWAYVQTRAQYQADAA